MGKQLIDCHQCHERYFIGNADPAACPQCHSTDITYTGWELPPGAQVTMTPKHPDRRELDFSVILDGDIDHTEALRRYWAEAAVVETNVLARINADAKRRNRETDRRTAAICAPILGPMLVIAAVLAWHDAWVISAMFVLLDAVVLLGALAMFKGWGRP